MGKSIKLIITLTALIAFGMLFLYAGNNWIKVSRFKVGVRGLPKPFDNFRILHISDLHGKEFGRDNVNLINVIEKEKPDLIFCSGDMLGSTGDDGTPFISLLKGLNGSYTVYYSLGNHEQIVIERDKRNKTKVFDNFKEKVKDAGAVLLDNKMVTIKRGGKSIALYGFTSMLYHYTGKGTPYFEGASLTEDFIAGKIGKPSKDRVDILLAHNPKWFDAYGRWGADITFSGHVHGGVVRIPFKGGVLSPDTTWFPEYDAGIYKKGDSTMHVSRGLGNSVIPFRIFNRPDVSVITLKAEQ